MGDDEIIAKLEADVRDAMAPFQFQTVAAIVRKAINGDELSALALGFTPAPGESPEDFSLRLWMVLDPEGPPPASKEQT